MSTDLELSTTSDRTNGRTDRLTMAHNTSYFATNKATYLALSALHESFSGCQLTRFCVGKTNSSFTY